MSPKPSTSTNRDPDLLAVASRYLPGGSVWQWTLPPELAFVVEHGEVAGDRASDPAKQSDWPAIAFSSDGALWTAWVQWDDRDADRATGSAGGSGDQAGDQDRDQAGPGAGWPHRHPGVLQSPLPYLQDPLQLLLPPDSPPHRWSLLPIQCLPVSTRLRAGVPQPGSIQRAHGPGRFHPARPL